MFLAKVIGNVVSTQKDARCQGMKLLLVQPHVTQGERLGQLGQLGRGRRHRGGG